MSASDTFWLEIANVIWTAGAIACVGITLVFHGRGRHFGAARHALMLAIAFSGLWAIIGVGLGVNSRFAAIAETARNLAWLFALYRLFAIDGRHAAVHPVRPMLLALAFVELLEGAMQSLFAIFGVHSSLALPSLLTVALFRLLVAIGGLVLTHNLYVGASRETRMALRWPAVALTVMWGADLNYFAITYLAGGQLIEFAALRGLTALAMAAALGIGLRQSGAAPRFQPSRAVAFQSASLLLIGGYLISMVTLSQWLSGLRHELSLSMQMAFLAIATAFAALLILTSQRLRGWLRVMFAKHLFQHRYDYRTEWLRFTETIGRSGAGTVSLEERLIRAVADIADSPAGALLVPDDGGGLILGARWQWPTLDVPGEAMTLNQALVFERSGYVADLEEIRSGKANAPNELLIPDWILDDPKAWALVPLLHFERLVGVVLLSRPAYARRLDWEDFDLLRVAGRQLASYLAEDSGQKALAEAARFDEFNRRIAFVMHDIKNLASQLGLLASNAERHAENPEFRADMLVTLRNSADKLNALIARLSRYGSNATEAVAPMRADVVAREVVEQFSVNHFVQMVECEPCLVAGRREALEQALLHLVQNAVDVSAEDSPVFVQASCDGLHGIIEVVDSGAGMSAEFVRNRLFKPFDSSKPNGFGIGAYEARELIRAMGGRLDVESREGLGSRFVIQLPLAETAELHGNQANNSRNVA